MSGLGVEEVWVLPDPDRATVRSLAEGLDVPGIVAQLLHSRGIDEVDAARRFLDAREAELSDPFLLTDMDRAVSRLEQARDQGEHVRVFGDYDVDGISATAIMVRGLRRYGVAKTSFAMPDRMTEGYGINANSVREAKADGVHVIVTVDNGVGAHDAADAAKAEGIDLIITDHHVIEGDLPEAHAIINPRRDDPESPFAHACGCAVAYKLAWALNGAEKDCALAALATIADIVPLVDENRTIVSRGLHDLAGDDHLGISALLRKGRVNPQEVRAEDIAFQVAPRINASGRLGSGMVGLELLLTDSAGEAERLASELDETNLERRAIEQGIYETALAQLEETFDPEQRTIVLASREWHPGVIGIVASKLQNLYWRPVVLLAINEEGEARGSGRSTSDFDLAAALASMKDLFEKFGGHKAAAGMTLSTERVDAFRDRLEAYGREHLPDGVRHRELRIDALVSLSDIDNALLRSVDCLEPFGQHNAAPVFGAFGVSLIPETARALKGGHLQCRLRQGNRTFAAIGFNMVERWESQGSPKTVDIAFRPKFNTWRGETTIQLHLKEIRSAKE